MPSNPQKLDFLAENWGNLASVAGLIVSAFAAIFAKRASTAAREARQAVLQRTLAQEVTIGETIAGEINTLIDLGKHELVRLRCNDLHDKTVTILTRWSADLPTESKNNCLRAKAQLESLRNVISRLQATGTEPTARQLAQMQDTCRTIRDIFVEENASAIRRSDEVNNA